VPHEGGQRFTADSWEYRVILAWIAGGAKRDPSRALAERVSIRPSELSLGRPGGSCRLEVVARFTDGTEAEVTSFCDLRAGDDAVVEVAPTGAVRGLRAGDTAVVASYNGLLASARVVVATGREVSLPEVPDSDYVDREVFAKLRALGIEPSGPASDAEFLRRVTLDVIGNLPSLAEVRGFLADESPEKRTRVIDALLAHPMHAALWANRFLDVTGCDVSAMEGPDELRPRRARMWYDWLCKRFADNVSYGEIARGILCATSRDEADAASWARDEAGRMIALREGRDTGYAAKPGLDLYWRRFDANGESVGVEPMAGRTAAALLGVRIECAQCHKHPFDRWTQADYRAFANIFADVRTGLSPEGLAATAKLLDERRKSEPAGRLPPIPRLREVYLSERPSRRLVEPATGLPLAPRALGGPEFPAGGDPRERLFSWLTRPDNPYFARSFVNRVWAAYYRVGLVEPVDGFSVVNPPSNGRLLDALAADFVANGYDIRRLERTILRSRAYQRSSEPNGANLDAPGSLARSVPRTLRAEVLVDVLNTALGVPGDFGADGPMGSRAVEIATNRVTSPDLARVFRILGRPPRTATCDCERPREPSVSQTLFLMIDPKLLDKIKAGRLKGLLASEMCDAEVVEELFLASLSRLPTGDEARSALDHLRDRLDREAAFVDLFWALLNTREFRLNH
jgi:hypothetical protein